MKIFRGIRKKLTKNGSALGYVAYGTGEIVLVVIGILIAVSLNNWNEENKKKDELSSIYSIVKKDLVNDVEEVKEVLDFYDERKHIYKKVIGDSLTRVDYVYNLNYVFLILGYPEISFDKRGFNLLGDFKSNSNTIQDSLATSIVDFYTERMLEIEVDTEFRSKDFDDNYFYWKNNYPWWSSYITRTDVTGFLDYALTDPDYKNRVANSYFLTYDVYIPELELFVERAEAIIDTIEEREE